VDSSGGNASLTTLLPQLLTDMPVLLDEVGGALARLDPGYAEYLVRYREEVLPAARLAVQHLVGDAVECLDGTRPVSSTTLGRPEERAAMGLFEEVGRDQWRQGLPVRRLLSAYQFGGRVGWRHLSAVAVRAGLPAEELAALAEAAFRLLDEISAATIAGFVDEQAQSAAARERLREALAERLVSDRAGSASVQEAARAAGWALPAQAAVVFVRADDEAGCERLARLVPPGLFLRQPSLQGVIVPDPAGPGRRQRLVEALRGTTALIGPTVTLADLPQSAQVTEAAARTLDPRGQGESPLFVVEHLDALIVHRDRRLLTALRTDCLRPLEGAAPASRDALRQTLRSWLVQMGNRHAVAAELGIHPQTVRYRLGRLHELFGPALEDPACRLRLLLALGWDPDPGAPAATGAADGLAARRPG
jgi:DNA-binding PucR family transcriptional regulator